jgi:hypothetical protein
MLVKIEHSKIEISSELNKLILSHPMFLKTGKIFVISTEQDCSGTILGLETSRMKALSMCFTRNKKKRKAFYSKCVKDFNIPNEILISITNEIKQIEI